MVIGHARSAGMLTGFAGGTASAANGQCLTPREPSWQPGDWFCRCGNHNLSTRKWCNRSKCQLPRSEGEITRLEASNSVRR